MLGKSVKERKFKFKRHDMLMSTQHSNVWMWLDQQQYQQTYKQ